MICHNVVLNDIHIEYLNCLYFEGQMFYEGQCFVNFGRVLVLKVFASSGDRKTHS